VINRRLATRAILAVGLLLATAVSCTEASTATGQKITLGFNAWPGCMPWQVAQEKGLFEQNGVDAEAKYFESLTDANNAVSTGAIDAAVQVLNDTLSLRTGGGEQLTGVLVMDNSTGADQIIAREGINNVTDLRGKKVAVEEGIVNHYLLLLALEEANLTQDDIELVPLTTDAAAAAFAAGQVDAFSGFAPYTTTALERPGSRPIATSAEFPGAIPDLLVVASSLVDERPEAVQALVNTWFDALTWIEENPEEATEIMAKRAGVSPEEYETYASGLTLFTVQQNIDAFTPGVTPKHLNFQAGEISDFITENGLADERPSTEQLFDDRFVKATPR